MSYSNIDDIDLRARQVMAIVNVTDDSFYAASRNAGCDCLQTTISRHIADGASILDIGGYSSRPGAADIPLEEEWRRVDMGVGAVRCREDAGADIPISIDTFRSEIVRRTVERYGRVMVNDITGGDGDERMWQTVAELDLPYVLMHMRGTPRTMQQLATYDDVVQQVCDDLQAKAEQLLACGLSPKRVVIDPGFGFAKTVEQNYALLHHLESVCRLGFPVLVGLSRKSMITRLLDIEPKDALCGTQVLCWEALRQGASILRVHDVRETMATVRMYETFIRE